MSRQPFAEADGKAILLKLRSMDPASYWDETNRVQKSLWRTLESALTTILTLTPRILNQNARGGAMALRGTASQVVTVLSAATIMSSVTKTLLSSTKLSRGTAKQRRRRAIDHSKLAKVIRDETSAIMELVEHLKGRPHPQVIHPALIAHAHQLVDALLAFCSPLAVEHPDPSRSRDTSSKMLHPSDAPRPTAPPTTHTRDAVPMQSRHLGSYSKQTVQRSSLDAARQPSAEKTQLLKSDSVGKRFIRSLIKSRQATNPTELRDDDIRSSSSTAISVKSSKSTTTFKFLFGRESSRSKPFKGLFNPDTKRSSIATQTTVSTIEQPPSPFPDQIITPRSSVQLLVSPFAKRTELRMADEDVDLYAIYPPHDEVPKSPASATIPELCGDTLSPAPKPRGDRSPMENKSRLRDSGPPERALPSPPLSAGMYRTDYSSWSMDTVSTYSDLDVEAEELQSIPGSSGSTKEQTAPSVVAVQSEHAAPTFVRSRTDPAKLNTKHFWGVNAGRLRHYRSESDLEPLQRKLVTSKKLPTSLPRALRSPGPRDVVPNAKAQQLKNVPHLEGFRFGPKPSQETPSSLSIRRNQSSFSLKKIPESPKIPLQEEKSSRKGAYAKQRDGSILHVSENGREVLVMEMISGKLHVIAATAEKLFLKLADETTQDPDYVDTYLLNHSSFTNSVDLLENLMARFHLEPQPGEVEYFNKWQRSIQEKVLNVINRWVKLQYQDFKNNEIVLTRLEAFLNGDIRRAGFIDEACMIREAIDVQMQQHTRNRHSLVALTSQSLFASPPSSPTSLFSYSSQRRPSAAPSLMSIVSSLSTPPDSPVTLDGSSVLSSVLLTLDAKDIARYLTLADFYLLKCITAYDYLHSRKKHSGQETKLAPHNDYIGLMTKRANMLSHWVTHEVCTLKQPKQRRMALRKLLEIAKDCLSWNNFHTSMVITIGLTCPTLQKLGEWQSLSSRDLNTMKMLQRNIDVSNNMSAYRKAFQKAKAPSIPFFPLVLKDMTFFSDGNRTHVRDDALVNFAKFRTLTQFVHRILKCTSENYWFAGDLEQYPFFSHENDDVLSGGSGLDMIADKVEQRIRALEVCYTDPHCEGHH